MKKVKTIVPETPEKKVRRKKRRRIILISILAVLIGFRIALPYIVKNFVNKTLANMEGYTGHVEDIDIHLYRGAYVIQGLEIRKILEDGTTDTLPFLSAPEIDLSIEWGALFSGSVVGEIYMEDPILNFSKEPDVKKKNVTETSDKKEEPEKKNTSDFSQDTADFRTVIKELMPLKINYFEITNGQVHYIDRSEKPKVDVFMKNINAVATNIKNVDDLEELLPSRLTAQASVYGGSFSLDVKFNGLNKIPTFDMNAKLKNVDMTRLNDFFKAYGNFDVKKGNLGLYTEFAAKQGVFNGYVKPILKDIDIVQWNKEEGNFGQIIWETILGSVAEIFQNQRKNQLATKIPIDGRFNDPKVGLFEAVLYVLKNAFVNALKPAIDNTIHIGNVVVPQEKKKGLLKRIFRKDKKPKK